MSEEGTTKKEIEVDILLKKAEIKKVEGEARKAEAEAYKEELEAKKAKEDYEKTVGKASGLKMCLDLIRESSKNLEDNNEWIFVSWKRIKR